MLSSGRERAIGGHAMNIGRATLGDNNWNTMTKKFTDVTSSFSQMKTWKAGAYMGAGVIAAGGLSYGASYLPSGVGVAGGAAMGAAVGWRAADQITRAGHAAGMGGSARTRSGREVTGVGQVAARRASQASRWGRRGMAAGGGVLGAIGGGMAMGVNRWLWD